MTKLSPAAQAVLDATGRKTWWRNDDIAAALRAAADQVVPEYREHHPATFDEQHRKVSAFDVRDRFFAIAAALEAQ